MIFPPSNNSWISECAGVNKVIDADMIEFFELVYKKQTQKQTTKKREKKERKPNKIIVIKYCKIVNAEVEMKTSLIKKVNAASWFWRSTQRYTWLSKESHWLRTVQSNEV